MADEQKRLVTGRIVVEIGLDEDGEQMLEVDFDDGSGGGMIPLLEGLGALSIAKQVLQESWEAREMARYLDDAWGDEDVE